MTKIDDLIKILEQKKYEDFEFVVPVNDTMFSGWNKTVENDSGKLEYEYQDLQFVRNTQDDRILGILALDN